MRLVIADCQVDYAGRLSAHLPMATRLIMVKADGSVSIHADDRAYKPLNWMSPPCRLTEEEVSDEPVADEERTGQATGAEDESSHVALPGRRWVVTNDQDECLVISIQTIHHDHTVDLGEDPGLRKDGVEAHLQALLAENPAAITPGSRLVRREYPTAIGPVDLLLSTTDSERIAVEVKRRGEIDGVEQLTRYLELMNRDPALRPVRGVLAAQAITPQARTLATDRGIECVVVDYDVLRGMDDPSVRLF